MTSTLKIRLRSKMITDDNGCWLWTAATDRGGYGRIQLGRRRCGHAHRAAYEVFIGPIPPGMHVLHRCDVRACINPAHLFIGTNADNVVDREQKGRGKVPRLRGGDCPWAKLSPEIVREIKQRLIDRETQKSIAARFGVSQPLISMINTGERWTQQTKLF